MRKTIAILCLMPLMTMAQTTSTSSAETSSKASSSNAGNAQNITYNTPAGVNYGGSYSVKSVGTAILPGFSGSFSGDYCGATGGAAGGGMGFAFSIGAPIIDSSCVLLRTYERTMQAAASTTDPIQAVAIRSAALELLAEINPTVRNVFESKGLVQVKDLTSPLK